MKDQLFKDSSAITRSADELQVEYTTGSIVARIWQEHLKPRIGLLLLATFAMLLTAATTGAIRPEGVKGTEPERFSTLPSARSTARCLGPLMLA